jgi:hypothetical protein
MVPLSTPEEVARLARTIELTRTSVGHNLNARSSRSHCLVHVWPRSGRWGIEKEFDWNFTRILWKLHVFLIISTRNSTQIPKATVNAHFGHRHLYVVERKVRWKKVRGKCPLPFDSESKRKMPSQSVCGEGERKMKVPAPPAPDPLSLPRATQSGIWIESNGKQGQGIEPEKINNWARVLSWKNQ